MKAVKSPFLPGAPAPAFAALYNCVFLCSVSLLFCPDFFCQPGECGSCISNVFVELGLKGEDVHDR